MIRLMRIPAPTINADLPVCSRAVPGRRGKRPVLSPTTAIVAPAASDAFSRVTRPSESGVRLAVGPSGGFPRESELESGDSGSESCSSFIVALESVVLDLRQERFVTDA